MEKKMIRNRHKCLYCGDIVESKHRHDFVSCKCGRMFVDGGLDYVRCGSEDLNMIQSLCEFEEEIGD